jgi:hypothetical protein
MSNAYISGTLVEHLEPGLQDEWDEIIKEYSYYKIPLILSSCGYRFRNNPANPGSAILTYYTMLRNYFTTAYRNLKRHKAFSAINILGLAIGMAACLLILQYITYQLSFDAFHENKDRLYRIRFDEFHNGVVGHSSAGSSPGVGPP